MCNLYTVRKSAAEVVAHFGSSVAADVEIPPEIKPGQPGIIVRGHSSPEALQALTWGFPRPQLDNAGNLLHPKLVNLVAAATARSHARAASPPTSMTSGCEARSKILSHSKRAASRTNLLK